MTKVLIVDDDRDMLFLIGEYLGSFGIPFDRANSAMEARRFLKNSTYCMIISDLNMPGESGLDLFRYIAMKHPELPFVLMTGCNDSRIKREARGMGICEYLEKPFRLAELAKIINSRCVPESRCEFAVPAGCIAVQQSSSPTAQAKSFPPGSRESSVPFSP